jgi:hypothetical protein
MSLPDAEENLQTHLGEHYIDSDWRPALKAVMDAKEDAKITLNVFFFFLIPFSPLGPETLCWT